MLSVISNGLIIQYTGVIPVINETKWYFPIAFSTKDSYGIALGHWYFNNTMVGLNTIYRNTTYVLFNSAINLTVDITIIAVGF